MHSDETSQDLGEKINVFVLYKYRNIYLDPLYEKIARNTLYSLMGKRKLNKFWIQIITAVIK